MDAINSGKQVELLEKTVICKLRGMGEPVLPSLSL